jgi:hypothetical protein
MDDLTCNECGKQKLESDHWFMLCFTDGYFQFWTWDAAATVDLEIEKIDGEEQKLICSEFCAIKALSKWMNALRAEAPVQRETEKTEV